MGLLEVVRGARAMAQQAAHAGQSLPPQDDVPVPADARGPGRRPPGVVQAVRRVGASGGQLHPACAAAPAAGAEEGVGAGQGQPRSRDPAPDRGRSRGPAGQGGRCGSAHAVGFPSTPSSRALRRPPPRAARVPILRRGRCRGRRFGHPLCRHGCSARAARGSRRTGRTGGRRVGRSRCRRLLRLPRRLWPGRRGPGCSAAAGSRGGARGPAALPAGP